MQCVPTLFYTILISYCAPLPSNINSNLCSTLKDRALAQHPHPTDEETETEREGELGQVLEQNDHV